MTVKEIFELRKQGRIEEAYDAIRPLYAAHRGRYTTLCMFWTAADVFRLRLDQRRYREAALILAALKNVLPAMDDRDGKAATFIQYATRRMTKAAPSRMTAVGRGHKPTETKASTGSEPSMGNTIPHTPPLPTSTNDDILDAYPGHMIVSLDDGLIRPAEALSTSQRCVLEAIRQHPGYRVPQLFAATGIPAKSVERYVADLISRHLVEHRGSKKTGGYYAIINE